MIVTTASRKADDGGGQLIVLLDDDGDAHVRVVPPPDALGGGIEFCTRLGGGRSPQVLRALRELVKAIEADNEADPLGAGR